MEVILVVIFVALFVTVLAIARGFVLSYLWQWFVVPFGLPIISVSHAIGVSLIVSFLTYQAQPKSENRDITEQLLNPFVQLIIVFIVGWIVHNIMVG